MSQELPPVLAHYMPWFQADWHARSAGWHWTMDRVDPFETGKVAAHITPLIGPYSSSDPHLIQYHLSLMKLCGIKGLIVNWYGTRRAKDFELNLAASDAIAAECESSGMLFTICYEDWTLADDLRWGERPQGQKLEQCLQQLRQDFQYISERYMNMMNFVRDPNGRAVILLFGPRILMMPEDWTSMLSDVFAEEKTLLLALPHSAATREHFAWLPPLQPSGTPLKGVHSFLQRYYSHTVGTSVGPVFPGFRDFYEKSYGLLPEHDGHTFEACIDRARLHQPAFVQLVTWNDWQEGTAIEPSKEREYYWLRKLQRHILGSVDERSLKAATAQYLASQSGRTEQQV